MSYDERREDAAGRPMYGPRGNPIDWRFWDDQGKASLMVEIPVICSWCKKQTGTVEIEKSTVDSIQGDEPLHSDGVCEPCGAQLLEEVRGTKKEE